MPAIKNDTVLEDQNKNPWSERTGWHKINHEFIAGLNKCLPVIILTATFGPAIYTYNAVKKENKANLKALTEVVANEYRLKGYVTPLNKKVNGHEVIEDNASSRDPDRRLSWQQATAEILDKQEEDEPSPLGAATKAGILSNLAFSVGLASVIIVTKHNYKKNEAKRIKKSSEWQEANVPTYG